MFDINWSYKHDIYNLICLPILIILNLFVLILNHTNLLEYFICFFLGYLIVDFIWIMLIPSSVSSPKIILLHHFITILGVGIFPYLDLSSKNIILLGSLVEINTFIRIIRKYTHNNMFLNILFYSSWFGIRCILGPVLLFLIWLNIISQYSYKWNFNSEFEFEFEFDSYYNFLSNLLLFIVGLILNLLNIKWTFDLVNGGWKIISDKNSKGL